MKKDLKGKERVVPPGIEIPGIPARKLVKKPRKKPVKARPGLRSDGPGAV